MNINYIILKVTDLGRPRVSSVKKSDKASQDQIYQGISEGRAGLDRKISTNLNDDDYYYGSTFSHPHSETERQTVSLPGSK